MTEHTMSSDAASERDALRDEIEQTRAELGETVEELAGRLDVKAQAAAAVGSATGAAAGAVSSAASSAAGVVSSAAGEVKGWGARSPGLGRAPPAPTSVNQWQLPGAAVGVDGASRPACTGGCWPAGPRAATAPGARSRSC